MLTCCRSCGIISEYLKHPLEIEWSLHKLQLVYICDSALSGIWLCPLSNMTFPSLEYDLSLSRIWPCPLLNMILPSLKCDLALSGIWPCPLSIVTLPSLKYDLALAKMSPSFYVFLNTPNALEPSTLLCWTVVIIVGVFCVWKMIIIYDYQDVDKKR